MNTPQSVLFPCGEANAYGRLTRRGLVTGAAGAAAVLASGVLPRSAFAQDRGLAAGMARADGAAASARVEVQQRLAAALGAGATAGTNQGIAIAQGAAASAMASADGIAETNGAVASAAAGSGHGAATKSAVTEAVVIAPPSPQSVRPAGRMAMPKPPAFARMAAPRAVGGGRGGRRGGGGGRNRRMRAVGGAAPARLPRTGVGASGFGVSALFGFGAAAAAGMAWLSARVSRTDESAV
ncbi:MAG TPA: hypothetical protein VFI22_11030 [Thermomicrobiales bacterium]|nr:hypothetical protein [Thermomicrobiales bacterium]